MNPVVLVMLVIGIWASCGKNDLLKKLILCFGLWDKKLFGDSDHKGKKDC